MFKGFTVTQFHTPAMAQAAGFGQEKRQSKRAVIKIRHMADRENIRSDQLTFYMWNYISEDRIDLWMCLLRDPVQSVLEAMITFICCLVSTSISNAEHMEHIQYSMQIKMYKQTHRHVKEQHMTALYLKVVGKHLNKMMESSTHI